MEELKEQLNLPVIEGYLIAYVKERFLFSTQKNIKEFFSRIVIIIPGPDNRYKSGIAFFDSTEQLKSIFEKSVSQMNLLKNQSFMGEYSKVISDNSTSKIEVCAKNGEIQMLFWAKSDGKYMYSRRLDINQVNESIQILNSAYHKSDNMINTLKELTN